MFSSLYQQHILDHAQRPRNKGVLREPCFKGLAKNPSCGDTLTLFVRVKEGIVTHVSFSGEGCALSQAAASLCTEKMRGMSFEAIQKFSEADILALLGVEVSMSRKKCALLVLDAIATIQEPCM